MDHSELGEMMTDNEQTSQLNVDKDMSYPEAPGKFAANQQMAADPAYESLLTNFQKADWETCNHLLDELLQKYPDDPTLKEFREDIEVKKVFKDKESLNSQEKKKATRKSLTISLLVVFGGILLALLAIVLISTNFMSRPSSTTLLSASEMEQKLLELEDQAQNFIRVGNTVMALETIQKIQEIDPNYPALVELINQANQLQELDKLYEMAIQYIKNNDYNAALVLLKQIEGQNATYKDIQYQISQIEKHNRISELLVVADTAYTERRWDDVITSYEEVLSLDPAIVAPDLEEQLFMSYYEKIKAILSSENSTIEEIDAAETYYYRAVALVAQDKAFAQERRDLQQFPVGLLNLKYRQIAKSIIESPYATEDSITKAVDYLRKAVNLAPGDAAINSELEKAQNYLLATQKFDRMEWDAAITNLQKLSRFQTTYANGMVQQMLFESYSARGHRFLNAGYFSDAQQDFEQAEIIAWENPGNKLQLFEAEVNMGIVLGKMYDYRNAIKYFNMAMDTANITSQLTDPYLINALQNARANAEASMDYASFEAYRDAITNLMDGYLYREVTITKGQSFIGIARIYESTITSIRQRNDLAESMTAKSDMTILVPYIQ
jgi:tetratricopeptide (TPR) repeat protein